MFSFSFEHYVNATLVTFHGQAETAGEALKTINAVTMPQPAASGGEVPQQPAA